MSETGRVGRLWQVIQGMWENRSSRMESTRTILLTLFIPSVDRDSKPIDQTFWRRGALQWLGEMFGGATAYPPGFGVWRDDQRGGRLVFDETIIIISYVSNTALRANIEHLRYFMIDMGRQTNQGSVAYVVDQQFFEIPIEPSQKG